MALNNTSLDLMLDALAAVAVWVSAHDGAPGTTGINEHVISTAPYGRESITWAASSAGNLNSSNTPVITINDGDTVDNLGLWSAETAGTFYGSASVTSEGPYGTDGTYTVTDFDVNIT